MNPARFTLKNNRTVMVAYAVIMLLGLATFFSIGRLEYPEFTIRSAQIITLYPGRTAVQVEQQVTEPLEQSIRQMMELDQVSSTSKPGISIISAQMQEKYFEMEDIWSDLRNKVAETRLPDGAQTAMVNDDFGDVFPYLYALRSDGFSYREMLAAAEKIRDDLLVIDGVSKVEFHGEQEERVYLQFSSSELAANGVSPEQAGAALSAQNAVASSGELRLGRERLDLVTLGEFQSLDSLAAYRLAAPGQATSLRIDDLFDVERDYAQPADSFTHYNGERVICIAVAMTQGGVVSEIGQRITDHLAEIQQQLPVGLDIEPMFFQPEYVDQSIRDFMINLGQAFFFVVLIMLLFAGWRIAMVVGILVPSAILMCFSMMPAAGVLLEMMSIAALIIALGLLVDNAVVVSEQILVRLGEGQDRGTAVIDSVKNLMIPLLAASLTTIAAFSPIALAESAVGEFTYSLFAVISLTLLGSWLLSITVIPLFCYWFLRPLKRDTLVGRGLNRLYDPYEKLLRRSLQLKWTVPALALVLTMVAGWGFQFVPNIFFPPNERGQFLADFELPLGTDITETEKQVSELEALLIKEHGDEIRSISSWIGNGGPRWYLSLNPEPPSPNYAFLSILTHSAEPAVIARLSASFDRLAENNFPDARAVAKALENGPPVGDPIQIRLYGEDMDQLYELRDRLVAEIKQVDGMYDVRDNWGAWIKQASVVPDPVRSARLGLNTQSIADALNLQFSGRRVTNFREGDKSIPVLMRSRADYRDRPERLVDLPVFTDLGVVPLGQVAEVRVEFLPGSIKREDTLRVMTILGRVQGRFSSEALAEIRPRLDSVVAGADWPSGYHIEYGGEQEESAEAQGSIGGAMPVSMSVLAMILIAQFNSLRRFGIIVMTLPPMLCGVVPGLLLTGSTFGFMTMLGLIALLGIIVNNAILLVDETDSQREGGLALDEAIVTAARSRMRPIIMTTITTIIGLLPLALGGGGMWSSMAYAMMFGLGFATLLTLLLCPVLYFLLFRRGEAKSSTNATEEAAANPVRSKNAAG